MALGYHPASVMPDQHPGWVGLGWNLQAGGAIYRVTDYIDDETPLYNTTTGYFESLNRGNIPTANWNTRSVMENAISGHREIDFSPDEFSFSFLGYSGKFYMNYNGEWTIKSDKHLKLEMIRQCNFLPNTLYNGNYPVLQEYNNINRIAGFKITADDGIAYWFGCNESAVEYSTDLLTHPTEDGYLPQY